MVGVIGILPGVIRLRAALERGLRNPWLRPILIVALALVLGLLVLHSVGENNQIADPSAPLLVCLALAFLLRIVVGPTAHPEKVPRFRRSPRAPPSPETPQVLSVSHPPLAPPLRL